MLFRQCAKFCRTFPRLRQLVQPGHGVSPTWRTCEGLRARATPGCRRSVTWRRYRWHQIGAPPVHPQINRARGSRRSVAFFTCNRVSLRSEAATSVAGNCALLTTCVTRCAYTSSQHRNIKNMSFHFPWNPVFFSVRVRVRVRVACCVHSPFFSCLLKFSKYHRCSSCLFSPYLCVYACVCFFCACRCEAKIERIVVLRDTHSFGRHSTTLPETEISSDDLETRTN